MTKTLSILAGILLILILTVRPGHSQPQGTTLFLPGDETLGPAAYDQTEPAISLGGDQSLVAWTDYRTGGSHLVIEESGADIFAARLDAAGELIDTTPLLLTMAAGDDTDPEIAWNGANWLVIWLAQAQTEFFWATEVRAVRVSPSGEVLDPEPIAIHQFTSSSPAEADLASDGTNWVVVMRGTQGGDSDILAARIGPDGTVLDPDPVTLVPGNFSLTFHLDLAFVTDEYLLTFLHQGIIKGLRFDTDLQAIDTDPFTIAAPSVEAQRPHVASNGAGFFVVWGEYNGGTQWGEARGTRVSYDGDVLDPGGLTISDLVFAGVDDPRIAWDGTNWVAIYKILNFGSDPDFLLASRITAAGQVLDVGGVDIEPVATGYAEPEIAPASGGGTRLVWQDVRAGGTFPEDISTFALSADLEPGAPSVVSYSAPAQVQPDAAYTDGGAMIVFLSLVSGDVRVMAHPLDADGLPILSEPLLLDSGPQLSSPTVAWNGSLYFAVWSEVGTPSLNDSVVWGQRINPDGTLVDATPFALMEGFATDVSAAGDDFLAVAIQQTINGETREPFGIRVDGSTGAVIGSPIDLGFSFVRHVAVAGSSDRWLVAFQRNFSHDDANAEIEAVFVESNGSLSAPISVATGLNSFYYRPDVAMDGTDGLVVWENANPPANHNVLGARVLADGTVGPIINVNNLSESQDTPAIAWDGAQYVTLYQDLRNITFFVDERSDVFGTLLDASGNVIDPQGFAVYDSVFPEISPAVASANGISLLTAAIFRAEPGFMAYRIGYSLLGDDLPTPTPTNTPTITPTGTPPTQTATPTVTPTGSPPPPTETPTPTDPAPAPFGIYLPVILHSP